MNKENKLYSFSEILTTGILTDNEGKVELHKIGRILIPMIQRPYAQGRRSQKNIRQKFLSDIFKVLANDNQPKLELNFVYGAFTKDDENESTFELLDGQQRLTTLFLLHWYVANASNVDVMNNLKKFVYQTRTSSADFLAKLLAQHIAIEKSQKPSKVIRNLSWYSRSFDKDTTVDSMLRMLDDIHLFYCDAEKKPSYDDLNKLQFYVLDLEGFGMTEELFIKMNARGLQLTPFENFKADLIGFLKNHEEYSIDVPLADSKMNRMVPYWLNFSSLLDCKWTNLFWQKPMDCEDSGSKECDKSFFRFIQRFFANKSIILAGKQVRTDAYFQFFSENIEVEQHLGFTMYESFINYAKEKGIDLIRDVEKLLSFLSSKEETTILKGLNASWEPKRLWEPWGTVGNQATDVGQRQMIILAAMAEFVCKFDSEDTFDTIAYQRWMRFVHNMVQATDITGAESQITLTRLLIDILNYESPSTDKKTWQDPYLLLVEYNDNYRNNRNLQAEADKAEQILADERWENVFCEAEANEFMQGSVTFYYEKGMSLDEYRLRTRNVSMLFDANGVTESFKKDFILMRAVLCRNYDWSSFRKNVINLNVTNKASNRFLRILTIWNDFPPVKKLFCQMLSMKSIEEMLYFLDLVTKEDHELILKDYWEENLKAKANIAYRRLYKYDEMKTLVCLSNMGIDPMKMYLYTNGLIFIYKGPVNCMSLSTERHKYLPKMIDSVNDLYGFEYTDVRTYENLKKYGNYTGHYVTLKSKEGVLPNHCIVKLESDYYDNMGIYVTDEKAAYAVYEYFLKRANVTNIKGTNDKFICDEEGRLNFHADGGRKFFSVNYIRHIDMMQDYNELTEIMKEIWHIINKVAN